MTKNSSVASLRSPAALPRNAGRFASQRWPISAEYAAVLALISGEVPISQVAGPAVVNSTLAGSDVVMIAGGATSLDYWLMSGREIKRADQLKIGRAHV